MNRAVVKHEKLSHMEPIRVLVSNDDGIAAPGIVALVSALGSIDLCDVYVSAPAQERSASSHAITLGQHITGTPIAMQGASLSCRNSRPSLPLPGPPNVLWHVCYACHRCTVSAGAVEAYAVDGKPADCTMLALHGPLFKAGTRQPSR